MREANWDSTYLFTRLILGLISGVLLFFWGFLLLSEEHISLLLTFHLDAKTYYSTVTAFTLLVLTVEALGLYFSMREKILYARITAGLVFTLTLLLLFYTANALFLPVYLWLLVICAFYGLFPRKLIGFDIYNFPFKIILWSTILLHPLRLLIRSFRFGIEMDPVPEIIYLVFGYSLIFFFVPALAFLFMSIDYIRKYFLALGLFSREEPDHRVFIGCSYAKTNFPHSLFFERKRETVKNLPYNFTLHHITDSRWCSFTTPYFSLWVTDDWFESLDAKEAAAIHDTLLEHQYSGKHCFIIEEGLDLDTRQSAPYQDSEKKRLWFLLKRLRIDSLSEGSPLNRIENSFPTMVEGLHGGGISGYNFVDSDRISDWPFTQAWLLFNLTRTGSEETFFYMALSYLEATLQTLGAYCLVKMSRDESADGLGTFVEEQKEKLSIMPSLGDWLMILQKYVKEYKEERLSSHIRTRLDSEGKNALAELAVMFDLGKQKANYAGLFSLFVNLRNMTIGHGVFTYEVSGQLIPPLAALVAAVVSFTRATELATNLQGLSPAFSADKRFGACIQISLFRDSPIAVPWLTSDSETGDVFFYNGTYKSREEWKSFATGNNLIREAPSRDTGDKGGMEGIK